MAIESVIINNPTIIFTGIPKIITFICGTTLDTNPIHMSVIIIIITIGNAIFIPIKKYSIIICILSIIDSDEIIDEPTETTEKLSINDLMIK